MDAPRKRIMVVDDEPSITRLLKLNLEADGRFEVRTVNAANHAIQAAREFHPDLILLDVMMPEVDGGTLASQMRQNLTLRNTPVVFLTAAATKEEVSSHGGKIGGLPFLAKPVDLPEVIRCIEKHLGT
jgi:CheY-like chemotaxis protein